MNSNDASNRDGLLKACFCFLTLAITIGIGRFSFTPIIALMKYNMDLPSSTLGVVAAAHHLGYLFGILLATKVTPYDRRSPKIVIFACVINAITFLTFPYIPASTLLWLGLRLVSGIACGVSFILAVNVMSDGLASSRKTWLPFFGFSGVGAGIVIGALGCLLARDDWQNAWYICGGLASLGSVSLMLLYKNITCLFRPTTDDGHQHDRGNWPYPFFLLLAYTIEGGAYIVTATFLVLGVAETSGISVEIGGWYWVFFGVVTAPSTLVWAKAVSHLGYGYSLAIAFWLQMLGALLATYGHPYILAFATVLLGITFMGITSITLLWARALSSTAQNITLQFTLAYSLAQFATPTMSGISLQREGSVNHAYIASAIALCVAGIIIWLSTARARNFQKLRQISLKNDHKEQEG